MRSAAMATSAGAISLLLGISVDEVIRNCEGRVTGVTGRAADGTTVTVRARLVIGADGMGRASPAPWALPCWIKS